jgi:hypothetical protein
MNGWREPNLQLVRIRNDKQFIGALEGNIIETEFAPEFGSVRIIDGQGSG